MGWPKYRSGDDGIEPTSLGLALVVRHLELLAVDFKELSIERGFITRSCCSPRRLCAYG
jgi:hypothetical protein